MPSPATHTWFWFFGAVCIVGAFLATAGILRRTMSVIDRGSRLVAATGIVLAIGGLGGSLAVAAAAPGSMVGVMSAMVGHGTTVSSPAPPAKPGVQKIDVAGVDLKFDPSTLQVPAGAAVQIVFQNQSSSSPHTFTIESESFELKADPGGTDSGTLKGLKPGTYQFICSIPGHAQLGMTGTLVVSS